MYYDFANLSEPSGLKAHKLQKAIPEAFLIPAANLLLLSRGNAPFCLPRFLPQTLPAFGRIFQSRILFPECLRLHAFISGVSIMHGKSIILSSILGL